MRSDFLLKYAKPGLHYTLATAPEAYLRSSAVHYDDLHTVLTQDCYDNNSKILAVCHPLADRSVWEVACKLGIGVLNEAMLSLEILPSEVILQLMSDEDHRIRSLAASHKNATEEILLLARNDSHHIVRRAANTRT